MVVTSGIIKRRALRTNPNTLACALALHARESFPSDTAAKQAFGVPASTNVRKLWLPRLADLDERRELGTRPVGELARPVRQTLSFACRHAPSCANAREHAALVRRNADRRRATWRGKRQDAPPPEQQQEQSPPEQPPEQQPPRRAGVKQRPGKRRCALSTAYTCTYMHAWTWLHGRSAPQCSTSGLCTLRVTPWLQHQSATEIDVCFRLIG